MAQKLSTVVFLAVLSLAAEYCKACGDYKVENFEMSGEFSNFLEEKEPLKFELTPNCELQVIGKYSLKKGDDVQVESDVKIGSLYEAKESKDVCQLTSAENTESKPLACLTKMLVSSCPIVEDEVEGGKCDLSSLTVDDKGKLLGDTKFELNFKSSAGTAVLKGGFVLNEK